MTYGHTERHGWRVHIGPDLGSGEDRLYVATGDAHPRRLTRLTAEAVEWEEYVPGVASDFRGLLVPRGVLDAVAEAVKPGPSPGEVARLEEALEVERARVDRLLEWLARTEPAAAGLPAAVVEAAGRHVPGSGS
jgi:hypothetical protein